MGKSASSPCRVPYISILRCGIPPGAPILSVSLKTPPKQERNLTSSSSLSTSCVGPQSSPSASTVPKNISSASCRISSDASERGRKVLELQQQPARVRLPAAPSSPACTLIKAGSSPPSSPIPTCRSSILHFLLLANSFRQPAIRPLNYGQWHVSVPNGPSGLPAISSTMGLPLSGACFYRSYFGDVLPDD